MTTIAGQPTLRISARPVQGTGRVFVGIGRAADVERNLAGVATQDVTSLSVDPYAITGMLHGGGTTALPPPTQRFCVTQATSTHAAAINWKRPIKSSESSGSANSYVIELEASITNTPSLNQIKARRRVSVERWYRDAKLYTSLKGTSEIQRLVIGRALGADANATRLTSGWPLRAERLFRAACGPFVRDTLLPCPCRTPTAQVRAADTVTLNAMLPTRRHRITAQPR